MLEYTFSTRISAEMNRRKCQKHIKDSKTAKKNSFQNGKTLWVRVEMFFKMIRHLQISDFL